MARIASTLAIVTLSSVPSLTYAQLAITEIMYDLVGGDTGREWVEVMNTSAEPITLTEWKLFEANSNHGLTSDAGDALAPGAYAIIADDVAKFKADWPGYTGLVVNSAFSLSNSGESLSLRCCGKDVTDRDSVSYASENGAAGDGNSLHRNGNAWTVGAPSPGTGSIPAALITEPETAPPEDTAPTGGGASASSATKDAGAISVEAGSNRSALAKSAISISAEAFTAKREPIEHGDYVWNFGDGRAGSGRALSHAWNYPGKYQVTLRVSYAGETASDAFVVDVFEPDFEITRFPDGSIGMLNGASRDADVSRWRVQDSGKNFVLPDGTVILKGALLRLSPETLGFMTSQASVHYPDGVLYARAEERQAAESRIVSQVVVPSAPIPELVREERTDTAAKIPPPIESVPEEPIAEAMTETEATSVASSSVAAVSASGVAPGWYWWLGALSISLIGAVGMVALGKPKDDWIIEDGGTLE